MSLRKKVVVVTGAAGSIGAAIAHRLASEGATIALLDLDAPGLEDVVKTLPEADPKHRSYPLDLSNADAIRLTVNQVLEDFGQIDILINNAGIVFRRTLLDTTLEEWDFVYAVNVRAPYLLMKAIASHMITRNQGGKIVNVASVAGLVARSDKAHYASSKAALIHLTRCSALELGPYQINVNVVCPGPTDTPLINHPVTEEYIQRHRIVLGTIAQPEDQAEAVFFLASPLSNHITGQVIAVDGGEVI